jgi:hypothetical protein
MLTIDAWRLKMELWIVYGIDQSITDEDPDPH